MSAFETMCRRQNVWLHVEGNALAGLILVTSDKKPCPTGDSMALTLGSWIGVPAVPFVTLYKVRVLFLCVSAIDGQEFIQKQISTGI